VLGVVEQARQLSIVAGYLRFALVVVPAFALMEQVVDTRFFQNMGAAQILDTGAQGGPRRPAAARSAASSPAPARRPREYCVQYRESDYEFASRLMQEEGISYRFEHKPGSTAEVLVLMSDTSRCADVERDGGSTVPFIDRAVASAVGESFDSFSPNYALRTTTVVQQDFDWTSPSAAYTNERRTADGRGRDRAVYDHDDRRIAGNDGANRARYKQEQRAAQTRVFIGTSDVVALVPGAMVSLSGHPARGARPQVPAGRGEARGLGARRRCCTPVRAPSRRSATPTSVECIEAERPWRPAPLNPKPRAHGLQTALVVGPGSEEIHTDEYGRIKVRFHWDRVSPYDDTASCWIRVAQRLAGAGWGSVWIPRIGMEVLVEFVDGDPDRPMVTGCVYNGNNQPPYPLPDQKTKSTTKSDSSPGGGGFNEIRFEDAKGAEELYVHAQLDMNTVVLQNSTRTVGMDDTDTVTNNQIESVGVDRTASVGNNESLSRRRQPGPHDRRQPDDQHRRQSALHRSAARRTSSSAAPRPSASPATSSWSWRWTRRWRSAPTGRPRCSAPTRSRSASTASRRSSAPTSRRSASTPPRRCSA
jgi:type VI secretion system secreted protein VgrG